MKSQHVQWGETICLVHALFPELSFHIIHPEKMSPNHIATAFRETGIDLEWEKLGDEVLSDLEILRKLIPDMDRLSGQAILVCGYCLGNPNINPYVVPTEEIEAFVGRFMESQGEPFFKSDTIIVVPDQNALFMAQNGRLITSYCPS
jgi:hypothetical protein